MAEIDLTDVTIFVRVVECGGFSAAARSLRVAKSSVSRRVARLEDELGVRLLQRTTRSLVLTDAGRTYFDQVSEALKAVRKAASSAGEHGTPRGLVRITAPPGFASEALPALATRFLANYPRVEIEVDLSASPTNLVEAGFDLAIRGGPQPDSSMVMRKLRDTVFRLYASGAYLDRAGRPRVAADLENHECVLFQARGGACRWELTDTEGDVQVVEVRGRVRCNGLGFARNAAIAGAGIALLPEVPGTIAVRRGMLEPVLAELGMVSSPLYLVYPSAIHISAAVRAFCDFLVEHFPTLEDVDWQID